ncbi:MAG: hypothetical protein E7369_01075 [Clostridiales bacterium]|nr:hypothetical protein [Clostridiales bacterium]
MEQKNEIQFGELLRRIGISLKKNWIIILIVVVLCTGIGLGYALIRKPTYTAYETANYKAQISEDKSLNDYTITLAYLDTFADFCKQDCVLDRANYYYSEFIKNGGTYQTVDDYIKGIRGDDGNGNPLLTDKVIGSSAVYKNDTYNYEYEGEEYFTAENVSVSASSSNDSSVSFSFLVGCSDLNQVEAQIKSKIFIFAVDTEVKVGTWKQKTTDDGVEDYIEYKYFGIKINFDDYGIYGKPVVDLSETKIVIISFGIGVVFSLVFVYLSYLLNRTVREKEELEALTGSSVLAFITNTGEAK